MTLRCMIGFMSFTICTRSESFIAACCHIAVGDDMATMSGKNIIVRMNQYLRLPETAASTTFIASDRSVREVPIRKRAPSPNHGPLAQTSIGTGPAPGLAGMGSNQKEYYKTRAPRIAEQLDDRPTTRQPRRRSKNRADRFEVLHPKISPAA